MYLRIFFISYTLSAAAQNTAGVKVNSTWSGMIGYLVKGVIYHTFKFTTTRIDHPF